MSYAFIFLMSSATLLLVYLFWTETTLLPILLLCISFISLQFQPDRKSAALLFVVTAVFGSISEIFLIHIGVWHYALPQLYGIPVWLPLAWGNASLFIKETYSAIRYVIRTPPTFSFLHFDLHDGAHNRDDAGTHEYDNDIPA